MILDPYRLIPTSNWLLTNLSAYYAMSWSSGAGETDLKGSYNLSLTGTVNSQTGKNGNARWWFPNANNNFLSTTSWPLFWPAIATSVSMRWYINAAPGNYETWMSLGGPSSWDIDFNVRVDNANHIQFDLAKNHVASNSATRWSTFSTGQRYHIVCTYDGAGNMVLYVNNWTWVTGTFSQTWVNNADDIMIGGQLYDWWGQSKVSQAPNLFSDEIAIWVWRVLSVSDVWLLYNSGTWRFFADFS